MWTTCTLDEAGRKSICASEREILPVRKGQGMRERSKLRGNRLVVEGTPPVDETRVMGMLRITIAETLSEQRWTLEGRLVPPWIEERKADSRRTEAARRERKCVV